MAKKKKGPVTLSNQELIPSVIGVVDDKQKGSFFVIVLFVLLIGFIIGLPSITAYITGDSPIVYNNPTNTDEPEVPENPVLEQKFYPLSDTLIINEGGISLQNLVVSNSSLSLDLLNSANSKEYLVEHQFYLELYDVNKMLLQRIKMPSESLNKGTSKTYSFDISVTSSLISQVSFGEKTISDYPAVNLRKENDDEYSLTCRLNNETLEYLFDENQKLQSITDTVNYSSNAVDYTQSLTEYRQMTSKYNGVDGVTSNISEVNNGFTVTTTIDLNKVDLSNRSIKNTLDNVAYYRKDTEGKVVSFELSAMNYKCS